MIGNILSTPIEPDIFLIVKVSVDPEPLLCRTTPLKNCYKLAPSQYLIYDITSKKISQALRVFLFVGLVILAILLQIIISILWCIMWNSYVIVKP